MSILSDAPGRALAGTLHSLAVGQVFDNKDPLDLGRVRVTFPFLGVPPEGDGKSGSDAMRTSGWFRVVRPLAAQSGDLFSVPDEGDEVVVGFLDSDPEHGVVLGQVSSAEDRPHADVYVPAQLATAITLGGKDLQLVKGSEKRTTTFENMRRVWRSRTGHMIVLDDSEEAPTIQILNKDKNLAIVLDEKHDRLLIVNATSDVVVRAAKNLTMEAGETFSVKAKKVLVEAKETLDLTAGSKGSFKTQTGLVLTSASPNLITLN